MQIDGYRSLWTSINFMGVLCVSTTEEWFMRTCLFACSWKFYVYICIRSFIHRLTLHVVLIQVVNSSISSNHLRFQMIRIYTFLQFLLLLICLFLYLLWRIRWTFCFSNQICGDNNTLDAALIILSLLTMMYMSSIVWLQTSYPCKLLWHHETVLLMYMGVGHLCSHLLKISSKCSISWSDVFVSKSALVNNGRWKRRISTWDSTSSGPDDLQAESIFNMDTQCSAALTTSTVATHSRIHTCPVEKHSKYLVG